MDRNQTIQFVHNLFKDVWTDLNEDKIIDYYHHNVKVEFGKQQAQYHNIINRLKYVKANFTKITNDIEDIIVEGDKVAIRISQTYQKHNDINSAKTYNLIAMYKITDRKVSNIWACIDPAIDYFEA